MTVLDRILQLRKDRDWTEYQLSKESDIAQTTISSWYKKNVVPNISSIEKLCKAFNITMTEFFAFDNEPVVLTDSQRELIDSFSRLDKAQQKMIIDLINSMK